MAGRGRMGVGGGHCPAGALGRSSRRVLRGGGTLQRQREVAAGEKDAERRNFALGQPEQRDKVQMTLSAALPASVGLGAFRSGWEVGGEGVGRGGGRIGEDSHGTSLVRSMGVV